MSDARCLNSVVLSPTIRRFQSERVSRLQVPKEGKVGVAVPGQHGIA
jgi:hypothetical protein